MRKFTLSTEQDTFNLDMTKRSIPSERDLVAEALEDRAFRAVAPNAILPGDWPDRLWPRTIRSLFDNSITR